MTQEQLQHIEDIKKSFFSEPYLSKLCRSEIIKPKFKELLFGFMTPKKMYVYNIETKERLEY